MIGVHSINISASCFVNVPSYFSYSQRDITSSGQSKHIRHTVLMSNSDNKAISNKVSKYFSKTVKNNEMSHGKKVELPSGDISDKLKLSKGEVKAHNSLHIVNLLRGLYKSQSIRHN